MNDSVIFIGEFLLNYWVHSSLFVGAALVAFKFSWLKPDTRGEYISRIALLAGIVSALLFVSDFRLFSQTESSMTFQWNIERNQQGQNLSEIGSPSPDQITHQDTNSKIASLNSKNVSNINERVKASKLQNQSNGANREAAVNAHTESPETGSKEVNLASLKMLLGRVDLAQLAVYVWALIAVVALCLRVSRLVKLHQFLGQRNEVTDLSVLEIMALLKPAKLDELVLTESENLNSPIVLNRKEIVLPANFSRQFKTHQVQAALAHELAHLVRKDNLWLKFYAFLQAILFIQPLNNLLIKQLYQIAEQQSDKLAAQWTGDPRALAEALAITAQNQINAKQSYNSSQIEWVPAMKSNKSNLLTRVEGLLGKSQQPSSLLSIFVSACLSLCVLVTLPGLSIQTVQAKTTIARGDSHVSIENGRVTRTTISHTNNDMKMIVEAKLNGDIQFNDEETEILDFPEDSRLDIKVDDGDEKRIVIERDGNDAIEYSYYEDGSKSA
ncbi:MAG: M56 family metallopeptidase, partial [Kangiellaceae bacterium]|nr:M56 family metallopeptidase [Kangiellaceae bacterium]